MKSEELQNFLARFVSDHHDQFSSMEHRIAELLSRTVQEVEKEDRLVIKDFEFQLHLTKKKEAIALTAVYHSIREFPLLRTYIGIVLEEYARKFQMIEVETFLRSSKFFFAYLQRHYTYNAWNGNFQPKMDMMLSRIRFRLVEKKKPKRTIRHRGYRDKGTLRPSHKWVERDDWTIRAQQRKVEETKEFLSECSEWNKHVLEKYNLLDSQLSTQLNQKEKLV